MPKPIDEILAPKPEARPRIYAYSIDDKAHEGLLKVGQTTRDVKQRVAEQVKTAAHNARFPMRGEQAEAVNKTHAYFHSIWKEDMHAVPRFLWNAKMRFGKTFTAYQLARKLGAKRVLVVTFKPAVEDAWQTDLESHSDFDGWQYLSRNSEGDPTKIDHRKPVVYFGSFQDLLGRDAAGNIKPKNEWLHEVKWDLVVFDEYHFGAWRDTAQELFEGEEDAVAKKEAALLKNEWVDYACFWGRFCPGGRELPTPNPAPRRGSPRRRTGSGAGGARLCLPRALKRTGEIGRLKGPLRRATPALDPTDLTVSGCPITHSKFKRGENTLQDVITRLEPDLFLAVTGLTVKDFHLLVRLKVFNTEQMNQAVFAFRRYEDASLRYTGIESHAGLAHYGLYDTVVAKD